MLLDEENAVPEITAANPDGGAARLDADPIDQSTSDTIDSLLDQAEAEDNSQDNSKPVFKNDQTQSVENNNIAEEKNGTSSETSDDIDPEIAAIQTPAGMSEKQVSNWEKLRRSASEYKKQAAEVEILRQKLAEQQQTQKLPEDYEELKRFRATFDLKSDPEFQSKYDKPINEASENIYSLLRKHKASEDVIKSIQEAGGPGKVAKSWWKKNAIDRLYQTEDFTDARRLENALVQIDDVENSRQADLQMAETNQQQWMAQKAQEREQRYQQEGAEIGGYVEKITENVPWAKFQEIPKNATQEQIEKINTHNASVRDLESKFSSALYPKTASERAAVAAAATLSHVVTNQLRLEQTEKSRMRSEMDRLVKENNALKASGKMPKSSVAGTQSKPASNNRITMNSSDAIDLGLDEAGA
jgi:hypothetical protein